MAGAVERQLKKPAPFLPPAARDAVEEFVKRRCLEFARTPVKYRTSVKVNAVVRDLGKYLLYSQV